MMKYHLARFAPILSVLLLTSCSDAQLPSSIAEAGPAPHGDPDQAAEKPLLPEASGPEVVGKTTAKVNELEWDR